MKNSFVLGNLKLRSVRHENVYDKECKAYREKHVIEISNKDKEKKYFTYTSQTLEFIPTREKLLENALYCFYNDVMTYEAYDYVQDFIEEYGYDEKTGRKIFNICENAYNKLYSLAEDSDFDLLANFADNYC